MAEESVMHVQLCCFAYKLILFFDVLVSVIAAKAPSSGGESIKKYTLLIHIEYYNYFN